MFYKTYLKLPDWEDILKIILIHKRNKSFDQKLLIKLMLDPRVISWRMLPRQNSQPFAHKSTENVQPSD